MHPQTVRMNLETAGKSLGEANAGGCASKGLETLSLSLSPAGTVAGSAPKPA